MNNEKFHGIGVQTDTSFEMLSAAERLKIDRVPSVEKAMCCSHFDCCRGHAVDGGGITSIDVEDMRNGISEMLGLDKAIQDLSKSIGIDPLAFISIKTDNGTVYPCIFKAT